LFYECMHIFDVILGGKKMKKTKTIPWKLKFGGLNDAEFSLSW
jgi:hypothetical protein